MVNKSTTGSTSTTRSSGSGNNPPSPRPSSSTSDNHNVHDEDQDKDTGKPTINKELYNYQPEAFFTSIYYRTKYKTRPDEVSWSVPVQPDNPHEWTERDDLLLLFLLKTKTKISLDGIRTWLSAPNSERAIRQRLLMLEDQQVEKEVYYHEQYKALERELDKIGMELLPRGLRTPKWVPYRRGEDEGEPDDEV